MPAPLTLLCAGAYGIRNVGDDLPLLTLMDGVRRLLPDHEVRFRALSRHPDPWEEDRYGVTMIPNLEYASREAARGRWFRGLNPDDDPAPFERVRAEIAGCDLLVLGAGNALLDHAIGLLRGPVPLMALYGALARAHGRPMMLYGMSVGPLRTDWGRDLSRRLIQDAAVVTVRDADSRDLCHELAGPAVDVQLLPDATLACAPPAAERGRELAAAAGLDLPQDRPVVALGLRDLVRPVGSATAERVTAAVVDLMRALADEATFVFLPQSTYAEDDDRQLAAHLVQQARAIAPDVRCEVVTERHHPRDLIALYGLAQVTVASRLHAAVFSAMAGVPPVGLDYLPKMRGFLASLGPEHAPLAVDGPGAVDGVALTAAVRHRLDASAAARARLRDRVDVLRREAAGYARLAVARGLDIKTEDPAP